MLISIHDQHGTSDVHRLFISKSKTQFNAINQPNQQFWDVFLIEGTVVNTPFLPRCMECSRGIAMGILSVRPSVRPSVRQTRAL